MYGKSITPDQLPDGIKRFFAPAYSPFPPDYRAILLQLVVRRIDEIMNRVKTIEWRIRGSSLLIVYEGDVDAFEACCTRSEDDHDDAESEGHEDDEEEDANGDCRAKYRIPFDVRLIDFAHTTMTPGAGPDEGFLLGLATTRRLVSDLLFGLTAPDGPAT